MKKLLVVAGLFLALTINAQERQDRGQRATAEQRMKEFDNYNLSPVQKQKIQALYKDREAKFAKNKPRGDKGQRPDDSKMKAKFEKDRKDFDLKIQKIMSKDQYAKFQADRKEHQKDGFRKDGQRPERKKA
ncbi:hypothetical protein [Epilithonimonas sp. UC225_85]|uniref:hypothetical protein n=1 Tax=Epilithonimonas sp. UC225_85 TaxID=3350167 RepID=UPI0036D39F04